VNALERDFVDAVKSAVPEVARTSASWIRGSVYLQFIVCSSYGTEKIKLHIAEEAVRHYVHLNSRMRFFARRRIKEYIAKRYLGYRENRGFYFPHKKLADPEWTVTTAELLGSSLPVRHDVSVSSVNPRFAVLAGALSEPVELHVE